MVKKKIMIVEDEKLLVSLLLATLGDDARYQVIVATDGEEALRLARLERPDLVFLDIALPKIDGYQVCRALKADAATLHAKVIMLTAMAQQQDRLRGLKAEADDYITKPYNPTHLLRRVEELLQNS